MKREMNVYNPFIRVEDEPCFIVVYFNSCCRQLD